MATKEDYTSMRGYLADELTDDDAKELAFVLFPKRSQQSKITNAIKLIAELERTDQFSANNTDTFLKVLKDREYHTAAKVLESYKSRSTENETPLSGEASTSTDITKSRKRKAPQTQKKNKKEKKKADKGDLEVTTEKLRDISGKISTKEWTIVGSKLLLEDTQLSNIEADNRNSGHQEVVYQMLVKWKRTNGRKATCRVLGKALKAVGLTDLEEHILK